MKKKKFILEAAASAPSLTWLLIFFIVPLVFIIGIAFRSTDPYGNIGHEWTISSVIKLSNPGYSAIILRTAGISLVTTVMSLLLAIPTGYFFARIRKSWRTLAMMMIIIPFWTNMLIRIYAWRSLLGRGGLAERFLSMIGITAHDTSLLYNIYAVVFIQVSLFLPFAILPVFAAAEKFDWSLIEAAHDLGAGRVRSFFTVFIPGISGGIITAVLLVFIPALGTYIVPDIVGGATAEMIGNKIAQRILVDRNLPEASALAGAMFAAMIFPVFVYFIIRFRSDSSDMGGKDLY